MVLPSPKLLEILGERERGGGRAWGGKWALLRVSREGGEMGGRLSVGSGSGAGSDASEMSDAPAQSPLSS